MLDRLVGRAVLAQSDRVVGKHMDHALTHQRRHAQRVARIIGEGQEGAAIRNESAVQCQSIHDRGHAELAHAVVDVPSCNQLALAGAQCAAALKVSEVTAGEVGRTADHVWQSRTEMIQGILRGLAGRIFSARPMTSASMLSTVLLQSAGNSPATRRSNSAASSGCCAR